MGCGGFHDTLTLDLKEILPSPGTLTYEAEQLGTLDPLHPTRRSRQGKNPRFVT